MELKRRYFVRTLLSAAGLLAAPVVRLAQSSLPRRWREAERCGSYPGPRRKIRPAEIKTTARWGG